MLPDYESPAESMKRIERTMRSPNVGPLTALAAPPVRFDPDTYFGIAAPQPAPRRFADGGPVMPAYDAMGNPTGMESIEQEGRAPGAYEALADRLAAAAAPVGKRIATIGEGARQIPGTIADYARDVTAGPDPSQRLASDIGKLGSAVVQGVKEDPLGAALDVLPVVGEIRSGMDAEKYSGMAAEAEAAGDEKKASMFRQLAAVAAAGTAPLAGMGARLAKRGMKAGVEAAEVAARELSPIGLYSVGEDAARALPQEVGTPEQMAAMLLKQGVKPVELEGFKEAFASKSKITRDEAADFFKERMPQVEEKVLGGKLNFDKQRLDELEREYAGLKQHAIDDPSFGEDKYNEMIRLMNIRDQSSTTSLYEAAEEATRKGQLAQRRGDNATAEKYFRQSELLNIRAEKLDLEGEGLPSPTKYSKYTFPGGENYREVLLKFPDQTPQVYTVRADSLTREFKTFEDAENYRARIMEAYPNSPEPEIVQNKSIDNKYARFRNQHWDDPDVIAHLRMSDRTGPNGEKILHLEEMQSDWAQKGRKEGFINLDDKKNMPKLLKEYDGMNEQVRKLEKEIANGDDANPQTQAAIAEVSNLSRKMEELAERMSAARNGIPSAPYVTGTQAWTDLALKRALREAAEGGYDKLVWTPGVEQAKRYKLSNHVNSIDYMREGNDAYRLGVVNKQGEEIDLPKDVFTAKELEDYLNKEVAQKIINDEGKSYRGRNHKTLEGIDLEVGGSGMKGYYDKIVPTQLQKIIKKLDPDAKIGRETIPVPKGKPTQYRDYKDWEKAPSEYEMPSITITPRMREEILKGLPAYAEGGEVSDDNAQTQDGMEEAYAKGGEAKSKQADIQRALVSFRKLAAERGINKPQLAYLIRQRTPSMPREQAALYANNILHQDILDLSGRMESSKKSLPVLKDLSKRVEKFTKG